MELMAVETCNVLNYYSCPCIKSKGHEGEHVCRHGGDFDR